MKSISVTVSVEAVPKGSVRAFIAPKQNRAIIVQDKHYQLRLYESILRDHLSQAMQAQSLFEGPVRVRIVFNRSRPKSSKRKKSMYACTRPDIDKLARAVLDAMTGIVFTDDAQVAALIAEKRYADKASVEITVEEIGA
jgi:Holliday junction resolvase RusA-like endonuclease